MNNAEIDKIYDGFGPEGQNMSREAFRNAIRDLTDQTKMQRDLDQIMMQRATEKSSRLNIERGLKRGS